MMNWSNFPLKHKTLAMWSRRKDRKVIDEEGRVVGRRGQEDWGLGVLQSGKGAKWLGVLTASSGLFRFVAWTAWAFDKN